MPSFPHTACQWTSAQREALVRPLDGPPEVDLPCKSNIGRRVAMDLFLRFFSLFGLTFAQVETFDPVMKPKGNNNEAIRWGCSFLCGTYPGDVRDWCAESGPSAHPASRRKRAMMAGETPLSDVRFLTVAEVALIMRVSKMTVYRLVHSGELEAIRVGRSFRVPEQAVNQYLRAAFVGT